MASAQAMEEELQQSVLLSQDPDESYDASNANAAPHVLNSNIRVASFEQTEVFDKDGDDDAGNDRDASGEEVEEDAEGEIDLDLGHHQAEAAQTLQPGRRDDQEEENEEQGEDAEGEDDAEDAEGVGAVKIKPGDSDDGGDSDGDDDDDGDGNDDEDDDSEISEIASAVEDESDEEAPWEDARDAVEEDEESEVAASNTCVFCKQDEENDPSEDFEAFLSCETCGENAHQQCARDAAAMSEQNDASGWRCPECYTDESVVDEVADEESAVTDAPFGSQASEVPRLARDLLAAKTGSEDGDSHSIFNDLVLGDDPLSSARLLRKRKTSSIDPDDSIISLRKRRRHPSSDIQHDAGVDGGPSNEATEPRSSRTLRLKVSRPPAVTVERHTRTSLLLRLQVRSGNLKEILSRKKRDRKRTGGGGPRPPRAPPPPPTRASDTPAPMIETPFTADSYSQPFYSFFDRDNDANGKPYGGILTEAEADTSKTLPLAEDRRRFDLAKRKADDEWRARVLAMQAEAEVPTRRPKKTSDHASQIERIEFGGWEIDTWYAAPYPAEYSRNRVLYICEFCLKYMNSDYVAWRHKLKCPAKHPPGDEIYRHGSISFFEVDGRKNPVYCQNLCLLAKLFLGSKTLYYDVEPFLFYVLCEYDECGFHFVGYFSKEKRPSSQNNVSCILTLPIHQRKGYGNLLIDFSYLLTKVEEKTGSPEKPLSDLGLVSYRSYWRLVLCRYLLETIETNKCKTEGLSIKQISDDTAMTPDDVIAALEGLRAIVRDPQTKLYAFRVDLEFCRQYVASWESKGHVKLKPEALAWTPYVMGRGNAANAELGPINTIAPREEDEVRINEGRRGVGAETQAVKNGVMNAVKSDLQDGPLNDEDADDRLKMEATPQVEVLAGEDKENATPGSDCPDKIDIDEQVPWHVPYQEIPPSRFEIFPPVSGNRRADRARQSISRPALSRTTSSAARPRPRPTGGTARRPTASRPKPNSSRRKTGGTGRGPGRWPKGTKKADYGNADSGPGFPPGWLERQQVLKKQVETGKASKDEIEEFTAREEVKVLVSMGVANGDSEASVAGSNSEIKASGVLEEDIQADGEDVDAEGEDA